MVDMEAASLITAYQKPAVYFPGKDKKEVSAMAK